LQQECPKGSEERNKAKVRHARAKKMSKETEPKVKRGMPRLGQRGAKGADEKRKAGKQREWRKRGEEGEHSYNMTVGGGGERE